MQRALASARALTEGWTTNDVLGDPAAAVADAWIRERMIPDVGNFVLYGWLARSGVIRTQEAEQRLRQFMIERDYVEPDYQTAHFGLTILSGQRLYDYDTWLRSLPDERRRIWDERVDQLRPGVDLRERIEALRTEDDANALAAGEKPLDGLPRGIRLLLEGLDASSD